MAQRRPSPFPKSWRWRVGSVFWVVFFELQLPLVALLLLSLMTLDGGPLLDLGGQVVAMWLVGLVVGAVAWRLTGPLNT